MLLIYSNIQYTAEAQLVTSPFECGKENLELCNTFIANGGLTCERKTQPKCDQQNKEEACSQTAQDICRSFIAKYGYSCDTTSCFMSLYTGR